MHVEFAENVDHYSLESKTDLVYNLVENYRAELKQFVRRLCIDRRRKNLFGRIVRNKITSDNGIRDMGAVHVVRKNMIGRTCASMKRTASLIASNCITFCKI